jgi:hypothetical protein
MRQNARVPPSGDHTGERKRPGSDVNLESTPRSRSKITIRPRGPSNCRSASFLPSGERRGEK